MSEPALLFESEGHVARLTLNRPERRNAIDPEMLRLFEESLDRIEADPEIRVVLLTGAGERVFCSGADLMASMSGGDPMAATRAYAALLKRLVRFPKPLVARLNGHCLAGGLGLMLACDMVYAHEDVTIGTPEVKAGLFPMMIGALIFKNVARKKAMEMIYGAETYPAREAMQMGMITRVYEKDRLDGEVDAWLDRIAGNAPFAIQSGRRALAEAENMELDEALDHLCTALQIVMTSEDAAEGISAFFQKRKPEWKGR